MARPQRVLPRRRAGAPLTPLGRQETWEDSPEDYPETPPYKCWNRHDNYDAEASPAAAWVDIITDPQEAARMRSADEKAVPGVLASGMSWRQYHVRESGGELRINVRFLHPGMTAVMLSVLAIFWSVVFFTKGARWELLAVMVFTSCFAWLIGFGKSSVSLKPGLLVSGSGPIPFDRHTENPSEIEDLSCTLVRTPAGRGGTSERYSVLARTRRGSQKPVTVLYGFMREEDAREVARLLTSRLNSIR